MFAMEGCLKNLTYLYLEDMKTLNLGKDLFQSLQPINIPAPHRYLEKEAILGALPGVLSSLLACLMTNSNLPVLCTGQASLCSAYLGSKTELGNPIRKTIDHRMSESLVSYRLPQLHLLIDPRS